MPLTRVLGLVSQLSGCLIATVMPLSHMDLLAPASIINPLKLLRACCGLGLGVVVLGYYRLQLKQLTWPSTLGHIASTHTGACTCTDMLVTHRRIARNIYNLSSVGLSEKTAIFTSCVGEFFQTECVKAYHTKKKPIVMS